MTIKRAIDDLTTRIFNIPKGIYFSRNHTWAFLEKTGEAKIGLNDFLAAVVGNVKVKMLKVQGENIGRGEVLAEMEQGNKHLKIVSPVSGLIVKNNEALQCASNVVFSDPYENHWLCAIQPTQWKADTNSFLLADEATKWILSEVDRFKDFLAVSMVRHSPEPALISLQEGGEIKPHILEEMDHNVWEDFQNSFLT